MNPEHRRRLQLALVVAGVVAAFAPIWFYGTLFGLFQCDGDGGSPYAARSSTVGRLCARRDDHSSLFTAWWVLVAAAVVAVVVGCTVTILNRKVRPAIVGLVAGSLIVGLYAGPFLFLDSRCSREDQAAYEKWLRTPDRPSRPPADCETY